MGGFFEGKGLVINGMVHISGREVLEAARRGALLVDLRAPIETDYKKFDVPDVLYIAEEGLGSRAGEIPRDRPVIVADSVGLRSKKAVETLVKQGYTNIANLNGGILEWERDGMPVNVDLDKQLSGSCTCRLRPRK